MNWNATHLFEFLLTKHSCTRKMEEPVGRFLRDELFGHVLGEVRMGLVRDDGTEGIGFSILLSRECFLMTKFNSR